MLRAPAEAGGNSSSAVSQPFGMTCQIDPSQAEVTEAIRRRGAAKRLAEQVGKVGIVDLDEFHRLIDRGLLRLHGGDYVGAREILLEAKEKFGMLPTAYNNLALCALVQGNLKEAEEWAQEVVRRFPGENPFGLATLADLHYLKGDVLGALDLLDRVEMLVPHSVDQATRVCESMAHFMDHERIVQYVVKSGYADAPELALFQGIALANLGRNDEAVRVLRIARHGQQPDYVEGVLEAVLKGVRPKTIGGEWMYFTHESFTLFAGLMTGVKTGGMQQLALSAEVTAEFVEVEATDGILDEAMAIKLLSNIACKRSERILNVLRSDKTRPAAIRKAADKTYQKLFKKNDLGKRLQETPVDNLSHVVLTEEACTHPPLDPAYEESYFKAVRICLAPRSRKIDLEESLRLLEDLHAKIPDNPAVTNNYASVLARLGRISEAFEITKACFAQHPEYVFGAANYLRQLLVSNKLVEAEAMITNYRLPLRIHPDSYLAWMRSELAFYEQVGDKERSRSVKKGIELVQKQLDRR